MLLTRPPLSYYLIYPKVSLTVTPLDLHVLGTPPAFILSQDQTLIKSFSLNPVHFKTGLVSFLLFCCSVFKELFFTRSAVFWRLVYLTILRYPCQQVGEDLVHFFTGGLKWTRTTDLTLIRRAL